MLEGPGSVPLNGAARGRNPTSPGSSSTGSQSVSSLLVATEMRLFHVKRTEAATRSARKGAATVIPAERSQTDRKAAGATATGFGLTIDP